MKVVSLADVEAQAHARLFEAARAFVAEGSGDQWTLAENRRAFNGFPIVPRRLRGVDGRTIAMGVTLLGHDLAYPIMVAPSGVHLFVHPTAEAATAAGASQAGALYTASGASTLPLEAIAKATSGPKWFQAYLNRDEEGIARHPAAGQGSRSFGHRADRGCARPWHERPLHPPRHAVSGRDDVRQQRPALQGRGNFLEQKTALTMDDIGAIGSLTGLPVMKGVLRAADARDAVSAGAAAIQVSNRGGRQADSVPASVSALPEMVDAVAGRVPVLLDGGIRRGIDVFRALALGATAVATVRPILFGAAVGGPAGVAAVLEHLRDDLHQTMLLAGTQTLGDVNRGCLRGIAA